MRPTSQSGEHTKQMDQRGQGGILFEAFRAKVRNLQKL